MLMRIDTGNNTDFYPRSPCGERRYLINTYHRIFGISIHALLAESDLHGCYSLRHSAQFLSTLSLRRATNINSSVNTADKISIHALLAESDFRGWTLNINGPIFLSTLSLRRATGCPACGDSRRNISIHALLAESDIILIALLIQRTKFLSTLSLRRATFASAGRLQIVNNFYPRSPCGERLATWQ